MITPMLYVLKTVWHQYTIYKISNGFKTTFLAMMFDVVTRDSKKRTHRDKQTDLTAMLEFNLCST